MALVVTQPAPSRRIAVVTAEESVLPNIQEWLSPGFETSFFNQAALILPASQSRQFEVVLLDLDTAAGSTAEGLEALRLVLHLRHPDGERRRRHGADR